jgi:hypothetical protein
MDDHLNWRYIPVKRSIFLTSIIVISAMILCISAIGFVTLSDHDVRAQMSQGQIDLVDMMSRNEVRLRIGESSGPVSFDRCLVVIFSPDNEEVNSQQLKVGQWAYTLSGDHLSLTSLVMVDENMNSALDPGDEISLFHLYDLQKGTWTLRVFVDDVTSPIYEEVFVVPDKTVTPYGAFHSTELVSSTGMVLTIGIWNTDVPYYYTSISITAPDGPTADVWNIGQLDTYVHSYNDTIWVKILDEQEQNIVNYNDAILVQSTDGPLASGDWTVIVRDNFTGGIICQAVVTVP